MGIGWKGIKGSRMADAKESAALDRVCAGWKTLEIG